MSNKSNINFSITMNVNGKKEVMDLGIATKQLDEIMKSAAKSSQQAQGVMKKWTDLTYVTSALQNVGNALQQVSNLTQDFTAAYQAQAQAEAQLEQMMRNTMDATDEAIQSIKDYCAAQQEIGVIGDEIQLAGAQKLASFLKEEESLKALIPVMNDMVASQQGLNATQEGAASAATLLGKALEGQTRGLKSYGIVLTEAQEDVLKYGTESEKVAMLAEVIEAKVGGMNEQLAQTPSGQMKQLKRLPSGYEERNRFGN